MIGTTQADPGSLATAVTNSPNLLKRLISGPVQTINDFSTTGLVNFVLPVAYHFCLACLPHSRNLGAALYVRALLKIENVVKYLWSMQSVNLAVQNVGPVGWCRLIIDHTRSYELYSCAVVCAS